MITGNGIGGPGYDPGRMQELAVQLTIPMRSTPEQHARGISRLTYDMLFKLQVNAHKGYWGDYSFIEILHLLKAEVEELEEALSEEGMRPAQLECADIANFAMMMHDRLQLVGMQEDNQMGLETAAGYGAAGPFTKPKEADIVTWKPTTFEDALDWAYQGMREIMMEKRRMRGPGNITAQGLMGVVNRMGEDKLSRIKREVEVRELRKKMSEFGVPIDVIDQHVPAFESSETLEDDLFDVGNYAAIAILVERGWWDLPLGGAK